MSVYLYQFEIEFYIVYMYACIQYKIQFNMYSTYKALHQRDRLKISHYFLTCGNKTRMASTNKPGLKGLKEKSKNIKNWADFGMGYGVGSYGGFCSLVETKTWESEGGGDQELGRRDNSKSQKNFL